MRGVVIAGGGLAGGAAATLLARAGHPVRLIERHAAPTDKICGEFLSIEAQQHLEALGIDLAAMGAVPVGAIRLVAGGRIVETRLPFVARGVSRRLLDDILLSRAEVAGAQIERGVRVLEIGESAVRTSAGERRADVVMLATGKLPVRDAMQPEARAVEDGHVGFKMHWRAATSIRAALDGCIELILFPGGYAGLQLVGQDIANLCLVIRRSDLTALGGRWEDVTRALARLSPTLDAMLQAEPLLDRPLTIANLAYGRLPDDHASRVFRLGDQAAMTASLTGDGMAIALRSAWIAAQHVTAGKPAPDYHRALNRMVSRQVARGMILQQGAERPLLRGAALALLRLQPGLLRAAVNLTRLPALAQP